MELTLFDNSSILDHFLPTESSILLLKMPLCLMEHILIFFKNKILLSFLLWTEIIFHLCLKMKVFIGILKWKRKWVLYIKFQ
jgi:hypothetical protein